MTSDALPLRPAARARLIAEAILLFVGVPVAMAGFFGQYPLFPVVFALTGVALGLLLATPGFRLADLLKGPVLGEWRLILGFAVLGGAAIAAVALWLVPGRFLTMPVDRTGLWLAIMLLYPLLSALPQEIIYRTLFFRRYGVLFPSRGLAVAANAAAFGFGHLFFMEWITILLSGLAGAVFALAYLRHGSTLFASVLHAIAGNMVFTAGLGIYFYHGAAG